MSGDAGLGGHADRPVRREGDVVVKTYHRADGALIHAEHRLLWDSPFGAARTPPGVPEPLSWDPVRRELRMEAVGGAALGARGDLGGAPARAAEAARLLAGLHDSGVRPGRRRGAAAVMRSLERKTAEMDGPAAAAFAGAVALAARTAERRDVTRRERPVATHGDWSPRNVLTAPDGLRVIDLDRLQSAGAGRDLAYWGAWCWVTILLRGEEPTWDLAAAYEREYLRARPSAGAEIAATLPFHRAAALLRIAHGWSALRARPEVMRAVIAEAAACATAG